MNINRATIAGFTGKDARNSSTQNGKSMTKLSVATTKRYKDAEGNWQEKTQWHTCVAYGLTADYAAKIQTGDHVFIEGELVYREYERTVETESGPIKLQWPVTEVVIESISVLDRKEKQERRGGGVSGPFQHMQTTSVYCVDCICGYHIESETDTLLCPGCQRFVTIEWPARSEHSHVAKEIEWPIAA